MVDTTLSERARYLGALEAARNARVISLVLGDRGGMPTMVAADLLPFVYDCLRAIGKVEEIDLFLYTVGGDSLAGWGLVNLIREHCDRFAVLAPFRCMSCGTLMALGADEVILASGAELSPVDPSVSSPYNPLAPGVPAAGSLNLLPVSVEDLIGFLHLVKTEIGLKDDEALARIIQVLAEKVHPLALGAVYRAREQVAFLARKLLGLHLTDQTRIELIVDYLTKSTSHQYIIGRHEARQVLGQDMVPKLADTVEDSMVSLYDTYRRFIQMDSPFAPEIELDGQGQVVKTYPRAALEVLKGDTLLSTVFRTVRELRAVEVTQPGVNIPALGVQQKTLAEGWVTWPEGGSHE